MISCDMQRRQILELGKNPTKWYMMVVIILQKLDQCAFLEWADSSSKRLSWLNECTKANMVRLGCENVEGRERLIDPLLMTATFHVGTVGSQYANVNLQNNEMRIIVDVVYSSSAIWCVACKKMVDLKTVNYENVWSIILSLLFFFFDNVALYV